MGSPDGEMASYSRLGNGIGVFAYFSFGILHRGFFGDGSLAALYDAELVEFYCFTVAAMF